MKNKNEQHKNVCILLNKLNTDLEEYKDFENSLIIDELHRIYKHIFDVMKCTELPHDTIKIDILILNLAIRALQIYKKNKNKEEIPVIVDGLHELYKTKNADYGDSVGLLYTAFGDISFFTRISDKYNRLMNLQNKETINYESIDDTLLDMANYCIIWVMERRLAR